MRGGALIIKMCIYIAAAACHYDPSGFTEGFVDEISTKIVKRAEDFLGVKLDGNDVIVKMDVHGKNITEYLVVGLVSTDALHVIQFEREEHIHVGRRTELATMLSKIIDCRANGPIPKLEHLSRFIH